MFPIADSDISEAGPGLITIALIAVNALVFEATGGVAFWAHIWGFLFGLLIGFLFRGRAEELTLESERRGRQMRRL